MSWETKIDKKITLNQTLKLIKQTEDFYLFEMQTVKGDRKTPRTIQITTQQDLSKLFVGKNIDKTHVMRFYVEKSDNETLNNSNIWKISESEHAVKISTKNKTNIYEKISESKSTKTNTKKNLSNNYWQEKINNLQTQINNLIETNKTLQKNIDICLNNQTSNVHDNKIHEQFRTELSLFKDQLLKESNILNAKISIINDNCESQKFLLTKEITKLEEKINTTISKDNYLSESNYFFQEQKQINRNNSNFHKSKQKRDWTYKGFIRKSVYCRLKNIKLLNTKTHNEVTINVYEIQVKNNNNIKVIKALTRFVLDKTLQLHFYIHQDMEKSYTWNINDNDNNITFSVAKNNRK